MSLTIEFGDRISRFVKPIHSQARPRRGKLASLAQRRVTPAGRWHLWLTYCEWRLTTRNSWMSSNELDRSYLKECLRELSGQRLLSRLRQICAAGRVQAVF